MSITAANTLSNSNLINSAKSAIPNNAVAESAGIEELGALFRDYHKTIFRVAYRITGSMSDAEDVLQTIFLRLVPTRPQQDLSPNPEAYLRRAAVNAALDLLRKRARAGAVPLELVDFRHSAKLSVASPEEDFEDAELRELLRHAVAKLEGRAAEAFALRYFEGLDNGQIAQVLGMSQMVVAVTLHRARTRLRKEIGKYLEKHYEAE